MPALRRLRQEDRHELQASLGYTVRPYLILFIMDLFALNLISKTYFIKLLFPLFLGDRVLLRSAGWPQTEGDPPALASLVLGSQSDPTVLGSIISFFYCIFGAPLNCVGERLTLLRSAHRVLDSDKAGAVSRSLQQGSDTQSGARTDACISSPFHSSTIFLCLSGQDPASILTQCP